MSSQIQQQANLLRPAVVKEKTSYTISNEQTISRPVTSHAWSASDQEALTGLWLLPTPPTPMTYPINPRPGQVNLGMEL